MIFGPPLFPPHPIKGTPAEWARHNQMLGQRSREVRSYLIGVACIVASGVAAASQILWR